MVETSGEEIHRVSIIEIVGYETCRAKRYRAMNPETGLTLKQIQGAITAGKLLDHCGKTPGSLREKSWITAGKLLAGYTAVWLRFSPPSRFVGAGGPRSEHRLRTPFNRNPALRSTHDAG